MKQKPKVERLCAVCNAPFTTYEAWIKKGGGNYCSPKCGYESRSATLENLPERFAQKLGETTATGCILWNGARNAYGYGAIQLGKRKRTGAHRAAWMVVHGLIHNDLLVLHSCDNPLCVNIEHLRLGTDADNMNDKAIRHRDCGEMRGNAKLREAVIPEIFALLHSGSSQSAVAAKFGVSRNAIRQVIGGRSWSHVAMSRPINPPM